MADSVLDGFVGQLFAEGTDRWADGTAAAFTRREWVRLAGGCVLCLLACRGLAVLFGLPAEPGFDGSLLASGAAFGAIIKALLILAAALVVGSVVAGRVGIEAAFLSATVGLGAVAVRCGPITPVLQYAAGRGVFLALAVETALLGAALAGAWLAMERVVRAARATASPDDPVHLAVPHEADRAPMGQRLTVLGVGVLFVAVCEMILVQLPSGKQALCGLALAAYVGAWGAYQYLPLGEGIWYWTAPMAAGLIGYLLAFITGDGGPLGELHGWTAALARPTPLDYASVGTAMALLGHWSSRRWAQAEEPPVLADADAPPAA